MKLVILSKKHGQFKILVDKNIFEKIKRLGYLKMSVCKKDNGRFYFSRNFEGKKMQLHRWIMGDPQGLVVDHINRNTLDNRVKNLRICTNAANIRNGSIRKNNKSGFTGVRYNNKRKRWVSDIKVNRKSILIGRFKKKEEAIKARKEAEVKYFNV